jgi:futalosine hydrolase
MNILIVTATLAEAQPMVNALKMSVSKPENICKTVFADHKITLLITGVGMVSTAFQLGKINRDDYNIALNIGIAGSFSKELQIGEVVNVTSDCFAELGADYGDKFIPLKRLDFAKDLSESFFAENGEIQNLTTTENPIINRLKKVKGITVNTVNGEATRIEKIKELFAPEIESMEGAAYFYACMKMNLPCFQLRAISNYIEPRNLNNWKIPFAIANLNKQLLEIITAF